MTKSYPFFLKNNEVIESCEARISFDHGGFCYGYGLFETILIYQGKAVFLVEHLSRLKKSAKVLNLDLTNILDETAFVSKIKLLIKKNDIFDARLTIYYVAGQRKEGACQPFSFAAPDLFAICRPFTPNFCPDPIKVGLVQSKFDRTVLDSHKTLNYMKPILDRREKPDCDEVIIIDKENRVLEASTANVFLVKGKTLITPESEYILPGIMREHVCGLAESLGYKLERRAVYASEIDSCDELFLTNSIKGVVGCFDLASSRPFKCDVTALLQERLQIYLVE